MSDSDATFVIDADVPAFLKDVDKMAEGAQSRFAKLGASLASVMGIKSVAGQSWSQTPVAKTTKELEAQHKIALELLKVERQKRDIARADRFERNRGRFGGSAELTEAGDLRRQRRDYQFHKTVQGIGQGITAGGNYAFSGGSLQGGMQLGNSIANMLAPQLAPIFSAISGVAIQALDADDRVKEAALRGYQVGGVGGANQLLDPRDLVNSERKQLGFNSDRFSSLQTQMSRRQGDDRGIAGIMRGENEFGIGSQMMNLQSAGYRTGTIGKGDDQTKLFGAAFGLQVGEGIGRGRLGEVMDQLSGAIEANTEATTDVKATADRFMFISQLGSQFRGNTAAAQGMDQSLKGLAQGQTGYTQMTALAAAGFGRGKTFFEAKLALAKGLDTVGGVSHEDLISTNFQRALPEYKKANAAGKARIVGGLALLTGMGEAKIQLIMDNLASGQGSTVDIEGSTAQFTAAVNAPEKEGLIGLHRQQVNAESSKTGFANMVRKIREGFGLSTEEDVKAGAMRKVNPWVGNPNKVTSLSNQINDYAGKMGVPPSFLQAWISEESGGDNSQVTNLNERGLFQIMGGHGKTSFADSEAGGLGMTEGEHKNLSKDPSAAMMWGAKLVGKYSKVAKENAQAYGLKWSDTDILRLTKLNHGGVGIEKQALDTAQSQLHRAPVSFEEMYKTVYKLVNAQAQGALDNAKNIKITIVDKTDSGIDAHKEVQRHAVESRKPAPGDTPAKHK